VVASFWSIYLRVLFPGVILGSVALAFFSGSNWPWIVGVEAVVLVVMLAIVAQYFGIGALFESRAELLEDVDDEEVSARELLQDLDRNGVRPPGRS
jgi:hypothetical protein